MIYKHFKTDVCFFFVSFVLFLFRLFFFIVLFLPSGFVFIVYFLVSVLFHSCLVSVVYRSRLSLVCRVWFLFSCFCLIFAFVSFFFLFCLYHFCLVFVSLLFSCFCLVCFRLVSFSWRFGFVFISTVTFNFCFHVCFIGFVRFRSWSGAHLVFCLFFVLLLPHEIEVSCLSQSFVSFSPDFCFVSVFLFVWFLILTWFLSHLFSCLSCSRLVFIWSLVLCSCWDFACFWRVSSYICLIYLIWILFLSCFFLVLTSSSCDCEIVTSSDLSDTRLTVRWWTIEWTVLMWAWLRVAAQNNKHWVSDAIWTAVSFNPPPQNLWM